MGRHERIPAVFSTEGITALVRRGSKAAWSDFNPVLRPREIAWESDTDRFKVGEGVSHWADLDYYQKVGQHEDQI